MIAEQEVHDAQKAWGDMVLSFSQRAQECLMEQKQLPKSFEEFCSERLHQLYDFEHGILFKPTLASRESAFRLDRLSALSYFIAADDAGFALKDWKSVVFENAQILRFFQHAMAMGHYHFRNGDGAITSVEYSFVYYKPQLSCPLKILLHHSSLPYDQRV